MKRLHKQNIRWIDYTNKISDEKITKTKYQMNRLHKQNIRWIDYNYKISDEKINRNKISDE